MTAFKLTALTSGWQFRQVGAVGVPEWEDGFLPVAQFPTNVHLDLMKNGKIPDPYIGTNEYHVQWVGEQQWLYKTEFHHSGTDSAHEQGAKLVLRFDGLDTFASISLNGQTILESDNMHRTYRVDVTKIIQQGTNTLEILFDVALIRGQELLEQFGHHTVQFNGSTEKSRVFVRKAQYHYGWNWGPELTTCGPWRTIVLEQYSARLADMWCRVTIDRDRNTACVKVAAETEDCVPGDHIKLRVSDPSGQTTRDVGTYPVSSNSAGATIVIEDAQLWWPVGYGEQPLYTLTAELLREDMCIHSITKRIGLREAGLVIQPLTDAPGTSFFVQVNGVPIFSNGSNWCPADHFVPRVTADRYRTQLNLLVEGNQNTIRVWAGGVFEEDVFYDICDELGILVWQDFLFACAAYPAHESFIENISAEVEDNIRRLRHHPSIVAWNGNNEDYLFAELFKTNYDIKDTKPENWLKSTFPARYIYEIVLPDLCKRLIPDASYHPGSPWGGKSFNDPTVGDTHRWEVWHYLQPWQKYPQLTSRFISEFGMASLPHVKTIDSYLVNSPAFERHPHSRTVDEHNKEHEQERKMATYLIENFRYTYDLEDYIYVSQLNQAEAMKCGVRSWHREWKGKGKEYCGGALIWQLNSTWQVTSKSLIDYFNRPKMAYYTVKRDMAPITIGMQRNETKTPRFKRTRAFLDKKSTVQGWATNLTLAKAKFLLSLQVFELSSGKEILSKEDLYELPPNSSIELFETTLSDLKAEAKDEPLVVSARLIDPSNKQNVVARCTNWPQPYRYLNVPQPSLRIQVDNDRISVATRDVPVKGLWFYVDDDAVDVVKYDDNCIDLVPGDEQIITAKGLGSHKLMARYYGMEKGIEIPKRSGEGSDFVLSN